MTTTLPGQRKPTATFVSSSQEPCPRMKLERLDLSRWVSPFGANNRNGYMTTQHLSLFFISELPIFLTAGNSLFLLLPEMPRRAEIFCLPCSKLAQNRSENRGEFVKKNHENSPNLADFMLKTAQILKTSHPRQQKTLAHTMCYQENCPARRSSILGTP